jgi:hypothetical protein
MRKLGRSALVLLVAALGCSGAGGGKLKCLPIHQVVGPIGADISISSSCDATLAGTELLVPAGALASSVTITVDHGQELAMLSETAVGPSVRFTPDGLAFAQPATLTLPFRPADQPAGTGLAIAASSVQGRTLIQGADITADSARKLAWAEIHHFTDYQVVAVPLGQGGDGGMDGGTDGGTDGGMDGGPDAGPDGGFDGGRPDLPPPIDIGGL